MHQKRIRPYSLPPGEVFPNEFKTELQNANSEYKQTRNFQKYVARLQKLFNLPSFLDMTEYDKHFFAGFIEGEGSFSVSAKKSPSAKFGVYLDPEFSITQHVNGSSHLFRCLCLFRTGVIRHKNKSNATLVYRIDNRETLKQKVIPYIKEYVNPNACDAKKERFACWCQLLDSFEQGAHHDFNTFLYEIGPLWDAMRMQKGQANESFKSLEDFQQYVLNHVQKKEQQTQISE